MNPILSLQPQATLPLKACCGGHHHEKKESAPASAPSDQVNLGASQPVAQQPPPPEQPPQDDPPGQQPPPQQPPPPSPKVLVTLYAQDPFVAGPISLEFDRAKIGENLSGQRVRIVDRGRERAVPDANGNYLMEAGTDQISQVNAHAVTYNTLDLFEGYRGGGIEWGFRDDALDVVPHKQEGRNAYYSRWEGSTNYFWFRSEGLDTTVKTANSSDVVAHETGHAILDGMRPGFFGGWDPETGAFHEAFGDCASMLVNLQHASNRDQVMQQTGGNLRQPNILAHLAEEFGAGVKRDNDDPSDDHKTYLRTAINSFTYVPPEQLPPGRGDEDHLGQEVHSFARLFAAAFYDVLEGLFMQSIYDERMCPREALKHTADVAGPLLTRSIDLSSSQRASWREIALNMIAADQHLNEGRYSEAIKQAFLARDIVSPGDFEQEELRQASLPKLSQNQPFASSEEAVQFVKKNGQELGLAQALPLEAQQMYTNDRGEQFVTLQYAQEVPVIGVEGFEGYTTDVHGGVTLVFGPDGKLTEYRHDAVTDKVIAAEMEGIAQAKGSNSILERPHNGSDPFASTDGSSIFKGIVRGKKLVRVPISSC